MEANRSSSTSPVSDDIYKDLESLVEPGEINLYKFFTRVRGIMDIPPEKHVLPLAIKIVSTLSDAKRDLEVFRGFGFKRTDDADKLPQSEAKFKCKCDERFHNLYQLCAHVVKNNENNKFLFECNVCNKQFSLKCELKQHLELSPSCKQDNACATAGTSGYSGTSAWNGGGAGVGPEVNLPNGTEEPEVPLETSNLMPPQDLEMSIDLDNHSQANGTDSTSIDVTPPSELEIVEQEDDEDVLDNKSEKESDSSKVEEGDAEIDLDLESQDENMDNMLVEAHTPNNQRSKEPEVIESSSDDDEDDDEDQQQENDTDGNSESLIETCFVGIAPSGLNMPTPSPNYGCTMCAQRFMTLPQLRKHEDEYHQRKQQKIWCGLCSETFKNCKVFHDHRAKAHKPVCNGEQVENVLVGIQLENDYLVDVDMSHEVSPLVSQDQDSIENGLNDNGGEMEEEWLVDGTRRRLSSESSEADEDSSSPPKKRKKGKKKHFTRRKVHKN